MNNTNVGIPSNMGMDHVGLVVPDAQRAADFLIEVFDAQFDWEVKRPSHPKALERGWSKLFDVHEEAYLPHVIMLKCGKMPLTQYIELFEWRSPDQNYPKGNTGWHKFSDIGNSYISFTVKDLARVIAHIKEKVIPKWQGTRLIQDPPMQFPLRGEICTSTFLVSPWGMWIEITCWSQSKNLGIEVNKTEHYLKGQHIHKIPTPALLVDLDVLDHNIHLMSSRIKKHNLNWVMPCKAHRSAEFATYIFNKTYAKTALLLTLDEVRAFANAGIENIHFASVLYAREDIAALISISKQLKSLRIVIDNENYLNAIVQEILHCEDITPVEVLIELNINHNRLGVDCMAEAVHLAKVTKKMEIDTGAVIFVGICGYEGHTPVLDRDKKRLETMKSHDILAHAKAAIEAEGIVVKIISGGGSSNYMDCLDTGIINEIQAGGGLIGDVLYCHKAGLQTHGHRIGAFLLTQIISVPSNQTRAVGDIGFKKSGWHPYGGYPVLKDRQDLCVIGLSAEHIRLAPAVSGEPINLQRGDKIALIPGYMDAVGFLHKEIFAIRNDHVEHVWGTIQP